MDTLLIISISYLLGSIPFGLILTRIKGIGDIRNHGSGNIGATNVMRVGGKVLGLCTLLLDSCKGLIPVLITQQLYNDQLAAIAGLSAIIGHVFPVWLRFKGGKGVATALGAIIAINTPLGLVTICAWIMIFKIFKISSLASLCAVLITIIAAYFLVSKSIFIVVVTVGILVVFKHKDNIKRLIEGSESPLKL